jgi:hypothetical protein
VERDDDSPAATDVVLVGPELEGGGHAVLRHRAERLEIGELREVREGKALGGGELVRLKQRRDHARLFDVEVLADLRVEAAGGPPQVATDAYRAGWELVFGDDDEPLN